MAYVKIMQKVSKYQQIMQIMPKNLGKLFKNRTEILKNYKLYKIMHNAS